jgi:hypothetical protein
VSVDVAVDVAVEETVDFAAFDAVVVAACFVTVDAAGGTADVGKGWDIGVS